MAPFFIDWVLVEWNDAFNHERFGLPTSSPAQRRTTMREVDGTRVNRLSSASSPVAERGPAVMCVLPGAGWQADAAA
jgi:hypothetical protein